MREARSGVVYRDADESDIAAMAKLRAASWGDEEYWAKRIRGYMECEIYPQKALKPRVSYVAVEKEKVVGLIAGHLTRRYECDGELEWIDVVVERRESGIATRLLERLAEWFVEQKALKICVDVQPANTAARRFYARHGAEDLNPHWMIWNDIRKALAHRT
jgi:ribosomal protein S18 acetylase RimI-like enzyme